MKARKWKKRKLLFIKPKLNLNYRDKSYIKSLVIV